MMIFRTLIFSPVLVVVMVMIIRMNDDFDDHYYHNYHEDDFQMMMMILMISIIMMIIRSWWSLNHDDDHDDNFQNSDLLTCAGALSCSPLLLTLFGWYQRVPIVIMIMMTFMIMILSSWLMIHNSSFSITSHLHEYHIHSHDYLRVGSYYKIILDFNAISKILMITKRLWQLKWKIF